MAKNISTRMQQKRDTQNNWEKAINFIPKQGEIVQYLPDDNVAGDIKDYHSTSRLKIGDGINTINNLPFVTNNSVRILSPVAGNYDTTTGLYKQFAIITTSAYNGYAGLLAIYQNAAGYDPLCAGLLYVEFRHDSSSWDAKELRWISLSDKTYEDLVVAVELDNYTVGLYCKSFQPYMGYEIVELSGFDSSKLNLSAPYSQGYAQLPEDILATSVITSAMLELPQSTANDYKKILTVNSMGSPIWSSITTDGTTFEVISTDTINNLFN